MTATIMPPAVARSVNIQLTVTATEPRDSSPTMARGESNGRRMTIFFRRPTVASSSSNRRLAVVMHGDVAAAIERFGRLDVLVNNAQSTVAGTPLEQIDDATIAMTLESGLLGTLYHMQAAFPGMREHGGSIINLGSVSWHSAIDRLSVYETAKAGIEGMTRALARDLGESNIRVNCVVPGAIRTPRQMKLWHTPEEEAKILAQQCLKQRVDPIHVTAMVLFLASADAAMCTAHNYWVDGGYR
jgi:NAD(P)-dependent dehydrogenase (short-subunit alcohol dehydrogenase family)